MVFVTDQTFTIVSRSQGLVFVSSGVPTPNVRDEFTRNMTAIDAPRLRHCRAVVRRRHATTQKYRWCSPEQSTSRLQISLHVFSEVFRQ